MLRFVASEWMLRSLELHQIAVSSMAVAKHVVLCGYGRTGQNLARFLEQEGIGYVALDLEGLRSGSLNRLLPTAKSTVDS